MTDTTTPRGAEAANTPRTAHQYLHDEAVWPDEDEAWHERVCENLRYIEAEAAAPTLADLPRTRGDGTVAYEPSDEPAAPTPAEPLDVRSFLRDLANERGYIRMRLDRAIAEYNRLAAEAER